MQFKKNHFYFPLFQMLSWLFLQLLLMTLLIKHFCEAKHVLFIVIQLMSKSIYYKKQ